VAHEPLADLRHEGPARLRGRPVHALGDEDPPLVAPEQSRAVDGVPVEPPVPLDKVEVVGPHGRAVLELDEATSLNRPYPTREELEAARKQPTSQARQMRGLRRL
jgi:hypothetical protein